MDLKEAFKNCVSGEYSFNDSRSIIDYAHTVALAYLRMKVISGHLYSHKGEPLEDLAWDFIAEIFERDNNGAFTVLSDVFSLSVLKQLSTEDIEQQFRRVIVTKVDDNIFRSNGEKDPSLKKIIRNLKNATANAGFGDNVEVGNGYLIINDDGDNHQQTVLSVTDVLEVELCHRVRENSQMPEVLSEVVNILEECDYCNKRVSLVSVAICIRKAFVHVNNSRDVNETPGDKPGEKLHRNAVEKRIELFADQVKNTLGEKYIHKNVLNREELSLYMLAVKEILRNELIEKHTDANHFECLKRYLKDVEYISYREQHRPVLEYLVKKTRAKIVAFYAKEWN